MRTLDDAYQFLKQAHIFYLATEENGQPHVRPFGAVDMIGGRIYIQTGKKKDVSKQLHKNPKVEICAFDKGVWLRITCEAIEDPAIESQQHLLDANPSIKRMYQAGDGNTEVFFLQHGKAAFYSFTAKPEIIDF
ncbi:MAG: pyridoxamine 5'-phosphate oxidase family protein [Bacilli bacterium]|jgi:uncharacterized pyridoxamine 5'-phosphate oxidase family protein|nr:pyridoxamine 5'-phosphate oxidase family protein [Bacilli bacterium]